MNLWLRYGNKWQVNKGQMKVDEQIYHIYVRAKEEIRHS